MISPSFHLPFCESQSRVLFELWNQVATILQIIATVTSCRPFVHETDYIRAKGCKTQKGPELRYIANKTRIDQKENRK